MKVVFGKLEDYMHDFLPEIKLSTNYVRLEKMQKNAKK
jgi:hypothetical protein